MNRTQAECVVNISEGRRHEVIRSIADAGGHVLVDVHSDPDHHRSVLTLAGMLFEVEAAARQIASSAVALVDLSGNHGVHPRFGVVDVVPFVRLDSIGSVTRGARLDQVVRARNAFCDWAGQALGLPCFRYGPERTLPEVRRCAFRSLAPASGPTGPHRSAGACAVGARDVLIAYNLWITEEPVGMVVPDGSSPSALSAARSIASSLRSRSVRALGLAGARCTQVSINVVDPSAITLASLYDAVARGCERRGCSVVRAELVGLAPMSALEAVPRHRWAELDLSEDRTIEGALEPGHRVHRYA